MIPAFRDVLESAHSSSARSGSPRRMSPDPEFPAGKVGQPGETVDEREVAVIVDRYETRPHERRFGREARGNRAM